MTTSPSSEIYARVREAATKQLLFLPDALNQMSSPARMISVAEVRAVIGQGVVIEDYPEDVRGHSCLLLGYGGGQRPIHVVCAPKTDYLPDSEKWEADWQIRKE